MFYDNPQAGKSPTFYIPPTRTLYLRDVVKRYDIQKHFDSTHIEAFRLLMIEVNKVANSNAKPIVDYIRAIPPEFRGLMRHFRDPEPAQLFMAAWVVEDYDSDVSLLVEKFSETSPHGESDDIFRVTGSDWTVTFLATKSAFEFPKALSMDWKFLQDSDGNLFSRRFHTATLFSINGDKEGFLRDVMIWKLSL